MGAPEKRSATRLKTQALTVYLGGGSPCPNSHLKPNPKAPRPFVFDVLGPTETILSCTIYGFWAILRLGKEIMVQTTNAHMWEFVYISVTKMKETHIGTRITI